MESLSRDKAEPESLHRFVVLEEGPAGPIRLPSAEI
jgi:hypothetical protein